MIAAVRSVIAARTAPIESWNVSGSAAASTQTAPVFSIHTWYSGKYGAMTMTSSPGDTRACREQDTEAAAPTVMKRFPAS